MTCVLTLIQHSKRRPLGVGELTQAPYCTADAPDACALPARDQDFHWRAKQMDFRVHHLNRNLTFSITASIALSSTSPSQSSPPTYRCPPGLLIHSKLRHGGQSGFHFGRYDTISGYARHPLHFSHSNFRSEPDAPDAPQSRHFISRLNESEQKSITWLVPLYHQNQEVPCTFFCCGLTPRGRRPP